MKRKDLKIFFFTAVLLSLAFFSMARPGGGHSFSSGRSFGGGGYGGYGGGSGGDILWIFYLLPPEISIPIVILIVLYVMFSRQRAGEEFTLISAPTQGNIVSNHINVARQIAALKAIDHNFSRVLFLDFVSSLYYKFYSFQDNKKQLTALSAFFEPMLLQRFLQDNVPMHISEIVIGGIKIEKIVISDKVKIFVRIKSNMTIEAQGKAMRYVIDERWTLWRDKQVQSPEPEKMHVLSCPVCGAPADFNDAGYCNSCGTLVVPGKMQWSVAERKVFDFSVFHTNTLLTYVAEQGTNLPTIYDPYLQRKIEQFCEIHGVEWGQYQSSFVNNIVIPSFDEIYKAWSSLRWNSVRHLLSDRLWEAYNFWIKAYKEHGWRNVLDVKVEKTEIVRVELDRFYEAITVRIFANGLDYVADASGKVLAGSKRSPRRFSEYWTFIRRTGVERNDISLHNCPACGAPASKIGESGICEYCGNKITWGDFSWILAIITQDEEYGY